MKRNFGTLTLLVVILIAATIGCDRATQQMIPVGPTPSDETMPPMPGSDEESANQLTLAETYDHTRNGARLIMAYDAATNTFKGTVENTTNAVLQQVRVEIHLSNSQGPDPTDPELGPTTPVDLAPGQKIPVELIAVAEPFDMWVAHPEVGPMSSGGGGEGGGEHGGTGGEGPEGAGEGGGEGAGGGAETGGAAPEGAEGGGEHAGGVEGAEGGGN